MFYHWANDLLFILLPDEFPSLAGYRLFLNSKSNRRRESCTIFGASPPESDSFYWKISARSRNPSFRVFLPASGSCGRENVGTDSRQCFHSCVTAWPLIVFFAIVNARNTLKYWWNHWRENYQNRCLSYETHDSFTSMRIYCYRRVFNLSIRLFFFLRGRHTGGGFCGNSWSDKQERGCYGRRQTVSR